MQAIDILKKYCVALAVSVVFAGLLLPAVVLGQNTNKSNKPGPMDLQVNTLTGNLFLPRHDLYIPSKGFNLKASFYYNSFSYNEAFGFGNGWSFLFDIQYRQDTTGSKIIKHGDGREDFYKAEGGTYKSPTGFFTAFTEYQTGKFLLTETDGTKYFFDNATHRKITKMEEPNGNFISFQYSDSLLTTLATSAGQAITLNYENGRLVSITDAVTTPTRTITYSYDASGNLTQVKDPLNNTLQYTYLVNGPMKTVKDKNNNTVNIIYYNDYTVSELVGCNKRISFSYDVTTLTTYTTDHLSSGNNQVTKYQYQKLGDQTWLKNISGNCCGLNTAFEFDAQGNRIKETDANGNVYKYTYDEKGNMLTITDPLNLTMKFTYTTDYNKIAGITDFKGNLYAMTYDNKGNLTQIKEPGNLIYSATYNAAGDIISSTDAKGQTYTYTYDAYGNPATVAGPNGYQATLSYDARGNLLSHTDARGHTSTAQYDILNRLKKIIDPLNNNLQLNYDAEGNMTSLLNKNNETNNLSYDASNRLVKFTNPMGNQTHFGYDGMNNLTEWNNAAGNKWNVTYNAKNQITAIKEPLNNQHSFSYDAAGNLNSVTLSNGQSFNYTYDNLNRIIAMADATGNIASVVYDGNNNVTSLTFGDGTTSTAEYDNLDRLTKIKDALGQPTSYGYDANGNVITATDRNNFTRSYTYDSLNRVKTYTDNNGFIITVTYDSENNIVAAKDQNNNITNYTYDELNRVKKVTYPDTRYVQFTYDAKGNIIVKRLTDGSSISYQYDTLNRPVARTLPDGNVIAYSYDALNRVVSATNNNGTVTLTYDALNRVATETYDGRTIKYNYNTVGRTQTIIYPDSTEIVKSFDTRNRLVGIQKNGSPVVTYAYNKQNRMVSRHYGNGVNTQLQYDFANRLNNLSTSNGAIQHSVFEYDKQRNKTTVNRVSNPIASEQFSYDNGYRLINYKRGIIGGTTSVQNTYAYDALGNRISANLNGTATTYQTNNLNQVTSLNNGSAINFTYDANGNLAFDGSFYKTYDAEGRLLKDSASPSNIITYQHDAFGRRTAKLINGNPIKYTYSRLAQIEERDGITNQVIKRTIFKSFLSPVLMEKNGGSYFYHQNEMNSVEAITNNTGNLVERYAYDAYGKPAIYDASNNAINNSIAGNHFGFTGQEYDFITSSYRFHYRNYSPVTGSFFQRDLIGYADGMGMYQYLGDNPANGIDILGLEDNCKPKEIVTQVVVQQPPSLVLMDIQFGLDASGNLGLLISVAEAAGQKSQSTFMTLKAIADQNYARMGEAAYKGLKLRAAGNLWGAVGSSKYMAATSKVLGKLGPALGVLDVGVKLGNLYNTANDPAASEFDVIDAQADAIGSGSSLLAGAGILAAGAAGSTIAVPAGIGLGVLALLDAGATAVTGQNLRQLSYEPMYNAMYGDVEYKQWLKTFGFEDSEFLKNIFMQGKGDTYLRTIRHMGPKPKCPDAGTQKPNPGGPGQTASTHVLISSDPNEIIGPDGVGGKKFVSVKDRLPYTITYENDKSATAPAKFVKIISPIQPKMDAATFQLGSFGFNNLTFSVPNGSASYYQRVDARDSLGLYVDVTAGYDQLNNQAFWEFQSIDATTLQPPTDPLKGFLLLQDSSNTFYGHGFVNFSIKPIASANTGDSISALASIIFDQNEVIPTNRHKNIIDAVAPTSSLTGLPNMTPDTEIPLHFSGADDLNGSGIKSFAVYVSDNNGPLELYSANFSGSDTTFKGVAEHLYKFYVQATDSVKNTEEIKLAGTVRVSNGEVVICPGGNTSFESNISGPSYQWQVDNGTGFTNISDGGVYSGSATAILSLTGAPSSFYAYQYRCLVNSNNISDVFVLKFAVAWEGTVSTAWENAANWNCNVLPDMHTDVIIRGAKERYPGISSNVMIRSLITNTGASVRVTSGYNLTIIK